MSAVDDILAEIPIDQLAAQLGVDERTAEQATRQALPALLGGMGANAQDTRGAASLRSAVAQHDSSLIEGGVDLADVDTNDGDKIVGHVFGDNRSQVVNQLGGLGGSGGGSGLIGKLLPLLAPIVMAYLAKQLSGAGAGSRGSAAQPDLGGLLGGLLGGGGTRSGSGGDPITDLLGGLLGGGRR